MSGQRQTTLSCRCGGVTMQATGEPIMRSVCYCKSCQAAGRRINALPGAPPVLGQDGGTDYVLYRKDRIRCIVGGDKLDGFRLLPTSPTRRMVASCCNSAMFLDFGKAHWLTVYTGRVPEPRPPLTARVMTAARPDGVVLPNDAPSYPGQAGGFMLKLLKAWLAMGFRVPRVEGVPYP